MIKECTGVDRTYHPRSSIVDGFVSGIVIFEFLAEKIVVSAPVWYSNKSVAHCHSNTSFQQFEITIPFETSPLPLPKLKQKIKQNKKNLPKQNKKKETKQQRTVNNPSPTCRFNLIFEIERLIDFNGMSSCAWLFYALSLGYSGHCTFLCCFFALSHGTCYSYIMLSIFKQVYLTYEILTSTITPGQSGPGSNGNKGILSRAPEVEPYYFMQFNVISRRQYMSVLYGLGNRGSIAGGVIPKTQKCYLIPPWLTLSIIRYVSRVKWSSSVVATERGAFGSPSTTVANFTYIMV